MEAIEFRTPEYAGGFYTCSEPGNNAGRYVRESDYNALIERHRRLVDFVLKDCTAPEESWEKLEAALAEEE